MRQIQLRLELRPRLRWGSLQRSPDPLAGFQGPASDGRGGQEKGRGRKRKGRERKGKGREGRGREESPMGFSLPKVNFVVTSLEITRTAPVYATD